MIRTRVGYAGGLKDNPDYRHMGDHTETVQVDYDPGLNEKLNTPVLKAEGVILTGQKRTMKPTLSRILILRLTREVLFP